MATNQHDVIAALTAAVQAVVDGLHPSEQILDPKVIPQTKLNKAFSVDVQTENTMELRDSPTGHTRERLIVTFRAVWRLDPKRQDETMRQALRDDWNARRAVLTSTRPPLSEARVFWRKVVRKTDPSREWLFADIVFDIAYNADLSADVDF